MELITIGTAVNGAGVADSTIRRWIASGSVTPFRVKGRPVLVSLAEVLEAKERDR